MIVEMKKVSLVMLKSEQEEALKKLRSLGVLHLESLEGKGEKLSLLKADFEQCRNAMGILSEIKLPKGTVKKSSSSKEELKNISSAVLDNSEKKKSLLELINQDTVELERLKLWGEVTPEDINCLAQDGIYLSLYEIPQDKWHLIGENVKTLMVNRDKNQIRFLLISDDAEMQRPEDLPAEAYAVPLPKLSTKDLKAEIASSRQKIASLDKDTASKAACRQH